MFPIILLFAFVLSIRSQTFLSSNILEDTTLTANDSPYILTNNIQVDSIVFSIEGGVVIQSANSKKVYTIYFYGTKISFLSPGMVISNIEIELLKDTLTNALPVIDTFLNVVFNNVYITGTLSQMFVLNCSGCTFNNTIINSYYGNIMLDTDSSWFYGGSYYVVTDINSTFVGVTLYLTLQNNPVETISLISSRIYDSNIATSESPITLQNSTVSNTVITTQYNTLSSYFSSFLKSSIIINQYSGSQIPGGNVIQNNLFVESYLQVSVYTTPYLITQNSFFLCSTPYLIQIIKSSANMNITATHNFFYNLNLTNIASLMYDRNQDLSLTSWINFLPISSLPSPSTPVLDADFTCTTPSPSLNPAPSPAPPPAPKSAPPPAPSSAPPPAPSSAPPPAPSPSPNPAPSQLQSFVFTTINTNTTFILGNFGTAFHQGNLFFSGTNNWHGTGTLVISGNLVCNTTSHLTITPDLNFDIQGSSTFDGSLTMDIPPDKTKNLDFFLSNPFKCNPCSGTFQSVGSTDPCFSTSETYTENTFLVLFGRSSSLCPSSESVWPQVVVGVVGALFLISMVVVGVMYFKSKKARDRKMESFLLKARETGQPKRERTLGPDQKVNES